MKFSRFFKKARTQKELTQKETVNILSSLLLSTSELQSLDVVSVSRWERGVVTPHRQRMILALRGIDANLLDFFQCVDVKESLSDFDAYRLFSKSAQSFGDMFNFINSRSFQSASFCSYSYDSAHPLVQQKELEMIETYFWMKRGFTTVKVTSLTYAEELQRLGKVKLLCRYNHHHDLVAHSFWAIYSICRQSLFLERFSQGEILAPDNDGGESFIYIVDWIWHDAEWLFFAFDELIRFLLENNKITRVFMALSIDEFLPMLGHLGFEVQGVRNLHQDKQVKIKLVAIDAHRLLSNSAIIKKIKDGLG